jgi:hypothetical protein
MKMARDRSWLNLFGILCLLSIFTVSLSIQPIVSAQTPLPPTSCEKSLEPRLLVGGYGRITSGNSNNVRNDIGKGDLVGQIPNGETFEVLDGPICADGNYWWQVHYSDFAGWTAEAQDSNYWLEPYVPHFTIATKDDSFHVIYDNLSFDVSTALTKDVNYHLEIADWNSENTMPEHVCFRLRLDLPNREPPNNQLCVIKTGDINRYFNGYGYVDGLQQILANALPLDVPDGQTMIPTPFNSGVQLMQAQVNYINADNFQGVRFITRYAQTYNTISGDALEYNFSGLTQDGQYIIFFEYAADTTLLPIGPATYDQLNIVKLDPLKYYKSVVDILNQGRAADFTPNLAMLDAIINSLHFQ